MDVSDIIATVGLAVSVLGIPITFILARRTRQRPELRYALDYDVILSPDSNLFDRGLYMTLGNHRIDSISRTRAALWNHRGDTIHSTDKLDSDPLRIQLGRNDEALQARVLSMSRRQVEVAAIIRPDKPSSVQVDFSFLDAGDGAIVEIIHRGPSKPEVLGTLQGADIRDAGSADLGADILKAAAQKSRLRRLLTYTPRYVVIPTLFIMFTVAYVVVTMIDNVKFQPSHLIGLTRYDLHTIHGQVAFARAVANTKAYVGSYLAAQNILHTLIPIIFALAFCGFSVFAWIIFKRKVPWNIISCRISDEQDNDQYRGSIEERGNRQPVAGSEQGSGSSNSGAQLGPRS